MMRRCAQHAAAYAAALIFKENELHHEDPRIIRKRK